MNKEEICLNPFKKGKCENTDIELYIIYKGKKLPICEKCWEQIADKPFEWGDPK